MSRIKPTRPLPKVRLRADEAQITVIVEQRDKPTLAYSHVVSKWTLDVDVDVDAVGLMRLRTNKRSHYSIRLATDGAKRILQEAR